MTAKTETKLSRSHGGRIVLHIAALLRDKKIRWHFAGIVREIDR